MSSDTKKLDPAVEKSARDLVNQIKEAGYMFLVVVHNPENGYTLQLGMGDPDVMGGILDFLREDIKKHTHSCDGDCENCKEEDGPKIDIAPPKPKMN